MAVWQGTHMCMWGVSACIRGPYHTSRTEHISISLGSASPPLPGKVLQVPLLSHRRGWQLLAKLTGLPAPLAQDIISALHKVTQVTSAATSWCYYFPFPEEEGRLREVKWPSYQENLDPDSLAPESIPPTPPLPLLQCEGWGLLFKRWWLRGSMLCPSVAGTTILVV